ncbi:MAG: copper homeostasis protein CutC [Acidobacteria bacterium]|nr:copper homeostasis protein CutC [Acidobacteriota bacterium]MBS1865711.1 copper homeostasis protein CutC [Acidobacteriota bacterium]
MTDQHLLLEISIESLDSAIAAERGGAHRIELCEFLAVGGVTPSERFMRKTRAAVKIPIFAMIRPRGDNFVYSASELTQMRAEIKLAKNCGMDGLVFGILHRDNTVDIEQTRQLIEFARPLPVTFHRAFDEAPDLCSALDSVISTGATRILTSGGKPTALEGTSVLADLVVTARDRIIILPGGGNNAANLAEVVRLTHAREFHSGLGTTLPYGQSSPSQFQSAVRELATILSSPL